MSGVHLKWTKNAATAPRSVIAGIELDAVVRKPAPFVDEAGAPEDVDDEGPVVVRVNELVPSGLLVGPPVADVGVPDSNS